MADIPPLCYTLNKLAGTLNDEGLPTLETVGAANKWAGTTDLGLLGALNTKAGNTMPDWKGLAGVLNQLAETDGLGVNEAASKISS